MRVQRTARGMQIDLSHLEAADLLAVVEGDLYVGSETRELLRDVFTRELLRDVLDIVIKGECTSVDTGPVLVSEKKGRR